MVTPVRADIAAAFDRLRESVARLSAILAQESAPREPAQERQDAPADRDYESGNDLAQGDQWQPARWLRHYAACHGTNDGARRKLFKAADALDRLTAAQPPGGADPLLPGLRAVEDKFRELTLRSDTNLTTDYAALVYWVSDEIARRDGTAWRGAEPGETT